MSKRTFSMSHSRLPASTALRQRKMKRNQKLRKLSEMECSTFLDFFSCKACTLAGNGAMLVFQLVQISSGLCASVALDFPCGISLQRPEPKSRKQEPAERTSGVVSFLVREPRITNGSAYFGHAACYHGHSKKVLVGNMQGCCPL